MPRPLQDAHYLTDLIVAKRDLGIIRGQAAPQFRGVDQKRGDVFQVFRLEARSVPLGMRSVRLVRGEVSKKRTTIPVPDEIFHPGKIKVAIFTLGRVLSHHGQPRVKRIGARRTKMSFARTQGAVAQRLEVRGQGPCTFFDHRMVGVGPAAHRIHPREQGLPHGGTHRGGGVKSGQLHPPVGELVEVGRFRVGGAAKTSHIVPGEIVGHEYDDVRLASTGTRTISRGRGGWLRSFCPGIRRLRSPWRGRRVGRL